MTEKNLRVCHFTYSFLPLIGGMEEVIHNLSFAMLNEGCEPYVFAPRARGRDNRLEVPYKVLRYSRPSSRRFGLRQLLIPLLWYHRKYKFDILHCHGVYPPGYVGISFQKITKVPVIITPHGGDIKKNEEGYVINPNITARIKKTFSAADAITVLSSDMKKRVLSLGACSGRIYLVPNGIFRNDFKPPGYPHDCPVRDEPYVLYLGRLREDKGIDVLLRAFCLIKKGHPQVKLMIAGEGREKDNLTATAEKLGISRSVEFIGMVQGEQKINTLHEALMLVCPSRREAFGIVNLEAFASGIPVIASRVGGIPDIIQDGVNGLLVEPDDPAQLADRMDLLINDKALRDNLVRNALACVSGYDWSNIAREYIGIYDKLTH